VGANSEEKGEFEEESIGQNNASRTKNRWRKNQGEGHHPRGKRTRDLKTPLTGVPAHIIHYAEGEDVELDHTTEREKIGKLTGGGGRESVPGGRRSPVDFFFKDEGRRGGKARILT